MRKGFDRYKGALVGWAGIVAWVVCVDEFSARTGRETMSRGFGEAGADPVIGPFAVGAWLGLCFHFVGEIVRSWQPRRDLFPLTKTRSSR